MSASVDGLFRESLRLFSEDHEMASRHLELQQTFLDLLKENDLLKAINQLFTDRVILRYEDIRVSEATPIDTFAPKEKLKAGKNAVLRFYELQRVVDAEAKAEFHTMIVSHEKIPPAGADIIFEKIINYILKLYRCSNSSSACGGGGDIHWWGFVREEIDRVASYIRRADVRIKDALLVNPADILVNTIADKINVLPRSVRRAGAESREPMAYFHFIYHKPRGVPCQPRQLGREEDASVRDKLPAGFPPVPFAGRLDADTEGLLLFSDNGKLLNKLMQPSVLDDDSHVQKTYYVQCGYATRRLSGAALSDADKESVIRKAVDSMRTPIDIKGSVTKHAVVDHCACPDFVDEGESNDLESPVRNHSSNDLFKFWVCVRLLEGKNRQIRRLCKRANMFVLRLIRANLGDISLGALKAGECRSLSAEEIRSLYILANIAEPYPLSICCPVAEEGADLIDLLF